MDHDSAFTPVRIHALNAVDLRLIGVTHGITREADGLPFVEGGSDEDFDRLLAATGELSAEHGDVLAIEPTGFRSSWVEDMTLPNIIPANIPEVPVADMSHEMREAIAEFLERGRQEFRLNNLVYAAAHTLLRGVPVQRAEATRREWESLQHLLPDIAPTDGARNELNLYFRNNKMLARLGDIAIDMKTSKLRRVETSADSKPILLFASGKTHTPRLGARLSASGVSHTPMP